MPPTNQNVPPGELPRPQYEPLPSNPPTEQGTLPDDFREASQSQMIEQGISPAASPMPATSPAMTSPPMDQTAVSPLTSADPTADSPQIADDADLIEKEWVTKAKQIVEQTKDDPYRQTKEMNKVKADYLKRRYAKELKLSED